MDNKFKFFTSMIFSKKVFKVVFGKQKLVIPEPVNGIYVGSSNSFNLSENYLKEWHDLLGSEGTEAVVPYTYYWPWLMGWLMKKLLPETGINLKNVLHMGHDAEYSENFHEIANGRFVVKNSLLDLCPLSRNKIDMVTQTIIESENGDVLFRVKDHTIVLNMSDEDMALLRNSEHWDHVEVPFRDDSFRKKESLFAESNDCMRSVFRCNSDIASKFGSVSGALSVTHATAITAKFFRQGKVFLQGMCTGNIVMKVLCHELGEQVKNFEVYFTNQLTFPQVVEIRYNQSRFEVFDESNTMVAYGSRKVHGAVSETLGFEERKVA